jgi:hypothetical protein
MSESVQQQAITLLQNPIVNVVSNTLTGLAGNYPADDTTRTDITTIIVGINSGIGLPSGEATFRYKDATGNYHDWPADRFIIFAQGVMNYIYLLSQAAGGNGTTIPNNVINVDPPVPPAPPPPTPPTLQHQAIDMLESGMQLACSTNTALNGTYPITRPYLQQIIGVLAAFSSGFGAPGGGTTFSWQDINGVPHEFTQDSFIKFAKIVINFNYTINQIIDGTILPLPVLPVDLDDS